jgi:Bacterial regulatory helix-turn-helix protein, lysR family
MCPGRQVNVARSIFSTEEIKVREASDVFDVGHAQFQGRYQSTTAVETGHTEADGGDAFAEASLERGVFRFRATLSQWRAFHAVVAGDGYAGAAALLHVTQPAVSYAIAKLERQFGIRLLRISGRKAHITASGLALLGPSKELLRLAAKVESMAASLCQNEALEE